MRMVGNDLQVWCEQWGLSPALHSIMLHGSCMTLCVLAGKCTLAVCSCMSPHLTLWAVLNAWCSSRPQLILANLQVKRLMR
jgi:hypothetical protein